MGKLLRSNFSRLWKDKIFWFCMGGMLIYAVLYMLNASQKTISPLTGEVYTLEHYYFMFLAYVGFFLLWLQVCSWEQSIATVLYGTN